MSKAKTGPKLEPGVSEVKARTFNVDPLTQRKLEAINPKNQSAALREAVRFYYGWWSTQPPR